MRAFRHFVFCVLLVGAFSGSSLLGYERIEFLEEHCISCHGPKKQKGDRRFDDLSVSVSGLDELERWQEILDMLNLEDMPPEEEPQPSEDDRAGQIAASRTKGRRQSIVERLPEELSRSAQLAKAPSICRATTNRPRTRSGRITV